MCLGVAPDLLEQLILLKFRRLNLTVVSEPSWLCFSRSSEAFLSNIKFIYYSLVDSILVSRSLCELTEVSLPPRRFYLPSKDLSKFLNLIFNLLGVYPP